MGKGRKIVSGIIWGSIILGVVVLGFAFCLQGKNSFSHTAVAGPIVPAYEVSGVTVLAKQ